MDSYSHGPSVSHYQLGELVLLHLALLPSPCKSPCPAADKRRNLVPTAAHAALKLSPEKVFLGGWRAGIPLAPPILTAAQTAGLAGRTLGPLPSLLSQRMGN
jgi:hypothetical protein